MTTHVFPLPVDRCPRAKLSLPCDQGTPVVRTLSRRRKRVQPPCALAQGTIDPWAALTAPIVKTIGRRGGKHQAQDTRSSR